MRTAALLSGGKDSVLATHIAVAMGHEVVVGLHLTPKNQQDEADSYMYQSVGSPIVSCLVTECLGLPLISREIQGSPVDTIHLDYSETAEDEVEDLFILLKQAKEQFNIEAVTTGAIFSDYQRLRVENVCARLNIVSLGYLWKLPQSLLLKLIGGCYPDSKEVQNNRMEALVIKVASMGLNEFHLNEDLRDLKNSLMSLHKKYQINVCGEGGEYETLVVNAPLYKRRIVIDNFEVVTHSADKYSPCLFLKFLKFHTEANNSDSRDCFFMRTLRKAFSDPTTPLYLCSSPLQSLFPVPEENLNEEVFTETNALKSSLEKETKITFCKIRYQSNEQLDSWMRSIQKTIPKQLLNKSVISLKRGEESNFELVSSNFESDKFDVLPVRGSSVSTWIAPSLSIPLTECFPRMIILKNKQTDKRVYLISDIYPFVPHFIKPLQLPVVMVDSSKEDTFIQSFRVQVRFALNSLVNQIRDAAQTSLTDAVAMLTRPLKAETKTKTETETKTKIETKTETETKTNGSYMDSELPMFTVAVNADESQSIENIFFEEYIHFFTSCLDANDNDGFKRMSAKWRSLGLCGIDSSEELSEQEEEENESFELRCNDLSLNLQKSFLGKFETDKNLVRGCLVALREICIPE